MQSSKKKPLLLLPPIRVQYCTTLEQQEVGCQLIQSKIAHDSKYHVWGFDCEWKVSYVAGQGSNRVALIQYGTHDLIVLFHISHSGLHSSLIDIIKSSDHIKIGVNIMGDILKLERDFPSYFPRGSIEGACDLRRLSEVTKVPPQRSLAGMVETELQLTLPKPTSTRCGDWEAVPLSSEQIRYASLDVYSSILVYESIVRRWAALPSSVDKNLEDILRKNFTSICGGEHLSLGSTSSSSLSSSSNAGRNVRGGVKRNRNSLDINYSYSGAPEQCQGLFPSHDTTFQYDKTYFCTCPRCCFRDGDMHQLSNVHSGHSPLIIVPSDTVECHRSRYEAHRTRVVDNNLSLSSQQDIRSLNDVVGTIFKSNDPTSSTVVRLTSKIICYRMWHVENQSEADIAAFLNIKPSTVTSYVIDSIAKGHEFYLSKFSISKTQVCEVVATCLVMPKEEVVSNADQVIVSNIPLIYSPPYKSFVEKYTELFIKSFSSKFSFPSSCINTESVLELPPPYWVVRVVAVYMSRSISLRKGNKNWVDQFRKEKIKSGSSEDDDQADGTSILDFL